jgi:hypothetical protein
MPDVGNTVTYTANPTPNVADNYAWSISGGGTIVGSSTSPTLTVNWTAPGTFQVNVTVSNTCSTFPVTRNEVITVACVPSYSNAVPDDIRCGSDPEVLLDPCNQYQKQIESCTNNVQWVFHSNNTACGGCVTTFFNDAAFSDSNTIDYFKSCPSNCTANPIPYTASSTVNIGTVSGSSQAQANANAQAQATSNVAADQAANGQNNANNTPDNIACSCTTTFSSTQTVTHCADFTRNDCSGGCTGSTVNVCRSATETRTSTNNQGEADSLAFAAATATATNQVNNDGQAEANSNGTCSCPCNISFDIVTNPNGNGSFHDVNFINISANGNVATSTDGGGSYIAGLFGASGPTTVVNVSPGTYTYCIREINNPSCSTCRTFSFSGCNANNWSNVGGTYCNGNDVVQDQVNDCGTNRTIVVQANGANIWTMTGNTTCVGSDLINEEVNGCGTNRYINVNTANHPSCAPDPCTVCNNVSMIGINGPSVAQLDTPVTFNAVIDIPECATYNLACGPCAYINNVPNQPLTIQYSSTFMSVGDTSEVVLTVEKPGCPLQTVSRIITIVA